MFALLISSFDLRFFSQSSQTTVLVVQYAIMTISTGKMSNYIIFSLVETVSANSAKSVDKYNSNN